MGYRTRVETIKKKKSKALTSGAHKCQRTKQNAKSDSVLTSLSINLNVCACVLFQLFKITFSNHLFNLVISTTIILAHWKQVKWNECDVTETWAFCLIPIWSDAQSTIFASFMRSYITLYMRRIHKIINCKTIGNCSRLFVISLCRLIFSVILFRFAFLFCHSNYSMEKLNANSKRCTRRQVKPNIFRVYFFFYSHFFLFSRWNLCWISLTRCGTQYADTGTHRWQPSKTPKIFSSFDWVKFTVNLCHWMN